jgi:hypothetical protein
MEIPKDETVTAEMFRSRIRQLNQRALVGAFVFGAVIAIFIAGFAASVAMVGIPSALAIRLLLMAGFAVGLLGVAVVATKILTRSKWIFDITCSRCRGQLSGEFSDQVIRTGECPHCGAQVIAE